MLESVNAHIQLERHKSTTCLNSSRVTSGPEGTLSGHREEDQRTRWSGEGGSSKMNEEGTHS